MFILFVKKLMQSFCLNVGKLNWEQKPKQVDRRINTILTKLDDPTKKELLVWAAIESLFYCKLIYIVYTCRESGHSLKTNILTCKYVIMPINNKILIVY